MAKKKHLQKKNKEILIREKGAPDQGDYYDVDQEEDQEEEPQEGKKKEKSWGKISVRLAVICVLLIAVVAFWLNRDNFSPENISNWFQTQMMGIGAGDGYPVGVTGGNVQVSNFLQENGNCVVLSDTALTGLNATGKEVLSVRHSYSSPALAWNNNRYLIYNRGGTNFSLVSGDKGTEKRSADNKITTAAIGKNGVYALMTQPADYASRLDVYTAEGSLKYYYQFAEGYATALTLNEDGSQGAVALVSSSGGELSTTISVFDFNSTEPVRQYVSQGNIVSTLYWEGGTLYAVGDVKTAVSSGGDEFSEYDYGGKTLTAVSCENGRALVSVSGYKNAGSSTLLIFSGSGEPAVIEQEERILDISSYGNVVCVLVKNKVCAYDLYSLQSRGECQVDFDTKAIAMQSESSLYTLGVSEIRNVVLEKKENV